MSAKDRIWSKGEYCVYMPDDEYVEVGRVISDEGDSCFVCFSSGCTAAKTPKELMLPVTNGCQIPYLGHHRFDKTCRYYQKDTCEAFCPEKSKPCD